MNTRTAFVLTSTIDCERALFTQKILEKIGFNVVLVPFIPHKDKVLSNKISFQHIYNIILGLEDNYCYVFEDDINIIEDITIDEIIQYENISEMFFYLGICEPRPGLGTTNTGIKINDHIVYSKSENVRGAHALGLSKKGVNLILELSTKSSERYMDCILEEFTNSYPANIVRYDLQSYIKGHRGIVFQDRNRFPSTI